jgi:hypothetical protein
MKLEMNPKMMLNQSEKLWHWKMWWINLTVKRFGSKNNMVKKFVNKENIINALLAIFK